MPYRHGAVHVPAPAGVPHLGARANLAGPPPRRVDWLDTCPADLDPLLNDDLGCCVAVVPFRRFQTLDARESGIVTPIARSRVLGRYEMNGDYVPDDPNNPTTNATDQGTDTRRDALNEVAAPILGADGAPREMWWGKVTPGDTAHVAMALVQTPLSLTLGLPVAMAQYPEDWVRPPLRGTGWDPASGFQHRVLLGGLDDGFWTVVTWGLHVRIHPDHLLVPGFVIAVDVFIETDRLQDLTLAGVDYDRMYADVKRLTA